MDSAASLGQTARVDVQRSCLCSRTFAHALDGRSTSECKRARSMGVLAVDWSLAAQCEQPCAQASANLCTGYGFAKAAGDDPQHVQHVGREHRERRAKVADQHDPWTSCQNFAALAEEGLIKHLGYFGRSDFELNCVIDSGNFTLDFSHLIYLSIMFGFIVIWCVLTLLWKDLTISDWCVLVFFRKRNDGALRH